MLTKLRIKLRQLYFKDTQFANLMTKRIFNVLLVANPYDAFMLEDDGRIDEKIFNEYMNLSLRYPLVSRRFPRQKKPGNSCATPCSIWLSVCRVPTTAIPSTLPVKSRSNTPIYRWLY